jgi:hypothetical protein
MSRISLHPLLYATSLTLLLVGCGGSNTQQLPPSGVAFVSSPRLKQMREASTAILYKRTFRARILR